MFIKKFCLLIKWRDSGWICFSPVLRLFNQIFRLNFTTIGYVRNVISGPYSPSFKTIFLPTLNKLWDKLFHCPPFSHTYLVTLSNSCRCRHKTSDQHRVNIWISAEEFLQLTNCLRCNFKHFYAEYRNGRIQSFLSLDHSRTQSPSYAWATGGSGQLHIRTYHKFPSVWIFWRCYSSLIHYNWTCPQSIRLTWAKSLWFVFLLQLVRAA